jgi:hypothetical protein
LVLEDAKDRGDVKLVAARIATDIALELLYNIRMMGFDMFGDNQSVIFNTTTIPPSQLKRNIQPCCTVRFMHRQSIYNAADVLTKPLGGILHRSLVNTILFGDGVPALFRKGIVELG